MMGDGEKDWLGNQQTIHEVELDAFHIAQYPVTQGLWEAVMGTNPSFFKGRDRPVEQVSWEECQEFLKKLNEQTGKVYRLPTEAEWEYAARGGQKSQGFTYSGSNKLKEVGWFETNSHGETKAVGQKLPNELGLYDMSGNVWEWCEDWYGGSYYQKYADKGMVKNPGGPENGSTRVYRGGGWNNTPRDCRVPYRFNWPPGFRYGNLGFRLAMSLQSVG